MYKIKKTIHCDTKPTWMVCLLYKIPPTVYDWQDSTDACKKRLTIIKNIRPATSEVMFPSFLSSIIDFFEQFLFNTSFRILFLILSPFC